MKKFFRDMKIRNKMLVTGFALFIPLVVLIVMLAVEKDIAIDFGQKEIYGVEYLLPLNHAVVNIPKHRGMANVYLNGDLNIKERLESQARKIDEGFEKISAVDLKHGALLDSTQKLRRLKEDWSELKNKTLRLTAKESFERHSALIADVIGLISHVGDTSNLILDPDLDSYYLMDAIVVKLPVLSENLGQLRGLTSGVAARQEITNEESIQAVLIRGKVTQALEGLSYGMKVAFRENPELKPILNGSLEETKENIHIFEALLHDRVLTGGVVDIDPETVFSSGTKAITSAYELLDKTSPTLTSLLQKRIDHFHRINTLPFSASWSVSCSPSCLHV
ncbi:MAG: nitrate- and nitrite sensing domain-containing protein [Nitrospiria bacterium]